jgi:hypothetical protein
MGGPVVGLLIDPTLQARWMPVLLFVSMTLAEISRARGFKGEHGLIVRVIFPFVGLKRDCYAGKADAGGAGGSKQRRAGCWALRWHGRGICGQIE